MMQCGGWVQAPSKFRIFAESSVLGVRHHTTETAQDTTIMYGLNSYSCSTLPFGMTRRCRESRNRVPGVGSMAYPAKCRFPRLSFHQKVTTTIFVRRAFPPFVIRFHQKLAFFNIQESHFIRLDVTFPTYSALEGFAFPSAQVRQI